MEVQRGKKIFVVLGERVRKCTFLGIAKDDKEYYEIEFYGKKIFKKHFYCFEKEFDALEYLINKLANSMFKAEERRQEIICEGLKR